MLYPGFVVGCGPTAVESYSRRDNELRYSGHCCYLTNVKSLSAYKAKQINVVFSVRARVWRALVTAGSRFVFFIYLLAVGGATCALSSLTLPFLVFVIILSAAFAVLFD